MAELDVSRILGDSRFLFLIRFAPVALRTLKDAPARIAKIRKFVDNISARCGFVSTSGKYDLLTIFEGTDEQAYQFGLYLLSRPEFETVDMVKFEAMTPKAYLELIRPLTLDD